MNRKTVVLADINPLALPCVAIADTKRLPPSKGIYFVLDSSGTILYIGSSNNLCVRWGTHHRRNQFTKVVGAKIHYHLCDGDEKSLEKALINRFRPSQNRRRVNNSSVSLPTIAACQLAIHCEINGLSEDEMIQKILCDYLLSDTVRRQAKAELRLAANMGGVPETVWVKGVLKKLMPNIDSVDVSTFI